MSTLPSLQVAIFILHFEQLKYLNNYLSIRTLFKPWLYLSHLDVYNIVILSTAKFVFVKKFRDWSCWSQSTFSNFHGRGEIAKKMRLQKKWDLKKREIAKKVRFQKKWDSQNSEIAKKVRLQNNRDYKKSEISKKVRLQKSEIARKGRVQ